MGDFRYPHPGLVWGRLHLVQLFPDPIFSTSPEFELLRTLDAVPESVELSGLSFYGPFSGGQTVFLA
jgi:hypothetical protein